MEKVSEEEKQWYIDEVYKEMENRGIPRDEIPRVIGKTGFMRCMEEYAAVQMHYDINAAVDDILIGAAMAK
jgi:hypothetical protein